MTSRLPPERIEFAPEQAAALRRSFARFYWSIAAIIAVAAIFHRRLLPMAILFPLFLLVWSWRLSKTPQTGWDLVIADDSLSVDSGERSRSIARNEASAVRFRRRFPRFAVWTELQELDSEGKPVFREGWWVTPTNPASNWAMTERGWPSP